MNDTSVINRKSILDAWSLRERNIVVTGGSKGIGLATVKALLAHGAAKVLFCSRTASDDGLIRDLQEHFADGNGTVYHVCCDLATVEGREVLLEDVRSKLVKIHGLINNVGVNVRKSILEQTDDEYHKIMQTNIDSAYHVTRMMFDLFEKPDPPSSSPGSSIVNVSSAAGIQSSGTGIAYAMSKAALNQFTRGLACEWAHHNIRVNAVAPWVTITPMLQEALEQQKSDGKIPLEKETEWTPLHRLAQPEEIANAIIFLSLPASSYITGQVLAVDGGLTAQGFNGPCARPSP